MRGVSGAGCSTEAGVSEGCTGVSVGAVGGGGSALCDVQGGRGEQSGQRPARGPQGAHSGRQRAPLGAHRPTGGALPSAGTAGERRLLGEPDPPGGPCRFHGDDRDGRPGGGPGGGGVTVSSILSVCFWLILAEDSFPWILREWRAREPQGEETSIGRLHTGPSRGQGPSLHPGTCPR